MKRKNFTLACVLFLIMGLSLQAQTVRYKGDVEFSSAIPVGRDYMTGNLWLRTSHGVLLHDALYVGLGTGVDYDVVDQYASFPLFVDFRNLFGTAEKKVRPFLGVRAGVKFHEETFDYEDITSQLLSGYFGWESRRLSFRLGYERLFTSIQSNIKPDDGSKYRNEGRLFGSVAFNF